MECEMDWAGILLGVVMAGLGFGVFYAIWPSGVLDIPFASLTLGLLLKFFFAVLFALLGVVGVFTAAQHRHV